MIQKKHLMFAALVLPALLALNGCSKPSEPAAEAMPE